MVTIILTCAPHCNRRIMDYSITCSCSSREPNYLRPFHNWSSIGSPPYWSQVVIILTKLAEVPPVGQIKILRLHPHMGCFQKLPCHLIDLNLYALSELISRTSTTFNRDWFGPKVGRDMWESGVRCSTRIAPKTQWPQIRPDQQESWTCPLRPKC